MKSIPKKSLGQHWLRDQQILEQIVNAAGIKPDDNVIEIGPGEGTLTKELVKTGAGITSVEIDTNLFSKLNVGLAREHTNLTVLNEDILEFRYDKITGLYKVIGNIPYYLTSNLIRKLSELTNRPEKIVLLIQKEVAERLCAAPGNMSLLSVWAQIYFDCKLGIVVPANKFTPPPKVDSQVVILDKREVVLVDNKITSQLNRVLKAAFSNKRKTLHNSLASGLNISKDESKKMLNSINISENTRPQELSIQQWAEIAKNA